MADKDLREHARSALTSVSTTSSKANLFLSMDKALADKILKEMAERSHKKGDVLFKRGTRFLLLFI